DVGRYGVMPFAQDSCRSQGPHAFHCEGVSLSAPGLYVNVIEIGQAGRPLGDREDAILFLAAAFFFTLAGAGRYSFDRFVDGNPRMTTQV
ncbi:MAG: hypothetical protein WD423_10455, partial [Rhodothermales bacterium]